MNTGTILKIGSTGPDDTEQIAAKLGQKLRGGEFIELSSDLGGGKTTFVRGLVRGAGSEDRVASPTFTINRLYKTPKLRIEHFDFYRLDDPGIIAAELAEVSEDPESVVVVEWGDIVAGVMPPGRLKIKIKNVSDSGREFTFDYPASLNYLMEEIK